MCFWIREFSINTASVVHLPFMNPNCSSQIIELPSAHDDLWLTRMDENSLLHSLISMICHDSYLVCFCHLTYIGFIIDLAHFSGYSARCSILHAVVFC